MKRIFAFCALALALAVAAATPLTPPLLVLLTGSDPYVLSWDGDHIELTGKREKKELPRKKCSETTFAATQALIRAGLNSAPSRYEALSPLRPQRLTPYDYEIRDGNEKTFYVSQNSRLGKSLKSFPIQFDFLRKQLSPGCGKK